MPMPPVQSRSLDASAQLVTLVTVVVIVTVLSIAREVFIPLALAVLLSFLLAPLVDRVQQLGFGRVPAVLVVTALSFVFIGAIGWLVAGQAIELAADLPRYRHNILEKIETVNLPEGGLLGRAAQSIRELSQDMIAAAQSEEPASSTTPSAPEPMPVQMVEPPARPLEVIGRTLAPLLAPLAMAGIVIVFVIFMLIQREDLRDRMLRLIGPGRLTATTQAIDDAAHRVSRYLLMQLIVNATYGTAAAIGLYFIGLPNALLWGVLATLLRFIPYVGPWIGASMPIALSLAAFDDWTRPLVVAGMFIVLELLSNNLMEPWLYGMGTGVSPVAIIASAVFWTWLWGPIGLVLATPLTVCLVVVGRYVPRLEFLNILLSDQPGLPPQARVYQRLLAMDQEEVFQIADDYLKERPLLDLYEHVLLPALNMAEHDRHHGILDQTRSEFIYRSMRGLVEELGERARQATLIQDDNERRADDLAAAGTSVPEQTPAADGKFVLCLPARDEADEIAAMMLAQLLEAQHVRAVALPMTNLASEKLEFVEQHNPTAVCISALPPLAVMHSRYLCKRLSAQFPDMTIVVGLWHAVDLLHAQKRIQTCGASRVVSTLPQALELLTA